MFSQVSVCPQGEGGVHPPRQKADPPWADTRWVDTPPPQQTATAADGTRPTGMHSCFYQAYEKLDFT